MNNETENVSSATEWLREGRLVYCLVENTEGSLAMRRAAPFINRLTVRVETCNQKATEQEAEALAAQIQAVLNAPAARSSVSSPAEAPAPSPLIRDGAVTLPISAERLDKIRGQIQEWKQNWLLAESSTLQACIDLLAGYDALSASPTLGQGAATPAAVSPSIEKEGPAGWVPVTSFAQVKTGDSLLVVGNIDGVEQHLFHKIVTKDSATDGQEIILRKKDNTYFNFGMYLDKKSWVKECYKLQLPAHV